MTDNLTAFEKLQERRNELTFQLLEFTDCNEEILKKIETEIKIIDKELSRLDKILFSKKNTTLTLRQK